MSGVEEVQGRFGERPLPAARLLAGAALAIALIAVMIIVLAGAPSYMVHADFSDAGQLVPGDQVEVGGISVGNIAAIGVSPDGQADISMQITDGRFAPLRQGTLAAIRAAGTAGIANRYIELDPGPSGAAPIADNGQLPATDTRGIVDLDMLLDAFNPPTRERLRQILSGADVALGSTSATRNDLALLDPAVSQTGLLGDELLRDKPALSSVIATTGTTLHALDNRNAAALGGAVEHLASVLGTVAGQRAQVSDILTRTTGTLHHLETTFGELRGTLPAVGTMLADARPASAPLVALLRRIVPDANAIVPALADLKAQLPATAKTLTSFPALARLAVPALSATQTAIADLLPIFNGLRPYTLDWMAGAISLIGTVQYAYYDSLGHYARETILGGQESSAGLASLLPQIDVPGPNTPVYRTGLTARCPGAAAEPAPDHSNPWVPDKGLCNPADDHQDYYK